MNFDDIPSGDDKYILAAKKLKEEGDERPIRIIAEKLRIEEQSREMQVAFEREKQKTEKQKPAFNLLPDSDENKQVDNEEEFNKFLQIDRSKIARRTEGMRIRAAVNRTFWEFMLAAKWEQERVFAACIAILKDYAVDDKHRAASQKAFDFILLEYKKYKIDDDRLMEAIQNIRFSWERQIKMPWNVTDELLRNKWLNVETVNKEYYNLTD